MKRVENILNDYKEESEKRFAESRLLLTKRYSEIREDVKRDIIEVFRRLFQETAKMQSSGNKDNIYFICMFSLMSSVLTKSYKYQISLFGKSMYLDPAECSGDYIPVFMIPFMQRDIEYLQKLIRANYVRLRHYEMEQMIFMHMDHYNGLMKEIFSDLAEDIRNMEEYDAIDKCDSVSFLFGGYGDYAEEI